MKLKLGYRKNLQKLVWIQQKYFETRRRRFSKKNRPRRGNNLDVMRILKEEFDS
jgi:hypothetical protein